MRLYIDKDPQVSMLSNGFSLSNSFSLSNGFSRSVFLVFQWLLAFQWFLTSFVILNECYIKKWVGGHAMFYLLTRNLQFLPFLQRSLSVSSYSCVYSTWQVCWNNQTVHHFLLCNVLVTKCKITFKITIRNQ